MLFNSLQFLVFLPIVVAVYYIVPDRIKHLWLLVCSYFFYMCWNAVYALLLLTSTIVTWLCGLGVGRANASDAAPEKKRRLQKAILIASLVVNLGILFFFKYFDFALNSLNAVLMRLVGFQLNRPGFDVLLPVGISFYTFQALGYTIDVYRGDIYPEKSFTRYALFVSFFPQLVAGPIERSKNLLSQLAVPHRFKFENLREGLLLMLWGFFMKIVIADRAALFVDSVYNNYADFGGVFVFMATLFFIFQVYCDFGGYSAIAIGTAKMLGVDLMDNFQTPFLSTSISEFWRRWHVSLSSWFRDYVYIPLGGNRKGTARKYFNILLTCTASGLWHGANWTYVVWGMLNGGYQVIGAILKPLRQKLNTILGLDQESLGHKIICILFTDMLFLLSMVFFRSSSISSAFHILRSMIYIHPWNFIDGSLYTVGLDRANFTLLLLCLAVLTVADILKRRGVCIRAVIARQDAWFQAVIIAFSVCFILLFGIWGSAYDAANFIYFQF